MTDLRTLDFLPMYYKKLFPLKLINRWLSYGDPKNFSNREFSFTLQNDTYIRFLSFNRVEEMIHEISRKVPVKIDIGAMYSTQPKLKRTIEKITPKEHELVFDIDMTDYDDVRTCCQGTSVCNKCWKFMVVACKILDAAIRDDFGFEAILWVFSGRRGIHCWICDKNARNMSERCRTAIAEYLRIGKGGSFQSRKIVLGDKIHASIKRALRITEPYFVKICIEEQGVLDSDENLKKFLNIIPDFSFREEISGELKRYSSSADRWDAFCTRYNYLKGKNQLKKNMKFFLEEIQLHYLYPRIDIEVTKQMNHLLKSPFCVHPGTGKISIPINPKTVEKFDVDAVPTLKDLISEISQFDKDVKETDENLKNIKEFRKTSLKKGVFIFEEFLEKLESQSKVDVKSDNISLDF